MHVVDKNVILSEHDKTIYSVYLLVYMYTYNILIYLLPV